MNGVRTNISFALDLANAKAGVILLQHRLSVEVIECLCGILASVLADDLFSSRLKKDGQ